jgi:hypothetical protein
VCSVPSEVPAADRARWLAEVSIALDEAQLALKKLSLVEDDYDLARGLHVSIEAARLEVQSLRLSRSIKPREQIDPERTEPLSWVDRRIA